MKITAVAGRDYDPPDALAPNQPGGGEISPARTGAGWGAPRVPGSGVISLAADLLFLLTALWTAHDWFTSAADPYPYGLATPIIVVALLSYFGYSIVTTERRAWTLSALLVILVGVAAAQIGGMVAAVSIASFCFLGMARFAGKNRTAAAIFGIAVVEAAVFVALARCGLFSVHTDVATDPWLGDGIGSPVESSALSPAAQIAHDIGIPGVVLFAALIIVTAGVGVHLAFEKQIGHRDSARAVLAAIATSSLIGVLFGVGDASAAGWTPVAVVVAATGLALAVSGVMAAARYKAPTPSPTSPRSLDCPSPVGGIRRPKRAFALDAREGGYKAGRVGLQRGGVRLPIIGAGGLFVAFVAVNAVTEHAVTPYTAGGWGVAVGRVPLTAVSQPMQDATIAMEDGHFYRHHGFDWAAIHHALRTDIRDGRIEEGGSTITQQLAKNLFLSSDRTLWRKFEEAALAWQLERMLPKRRILELYLNTIDYGMGQRGIGAAAQYYFHQQPARLTLAESACLVGIVPDPMHQELNFGRVSEGERTALGRIIFFFPKRYSQTDSDRAFAIRLDQLIYPDKDAWDRGATETIPGTWHGVSFYFFANPDTPGDIGNAAACFKTRLAGFLDDARQHLGIVGIDHLGLYNDRGMRQAESHLSAHAFGQAMDMSGFRFKGGADIRVQDHAQPAVARRLAPVEALLKRHFDIVVDWRDDPLRHTTHFHVEVKGPRSSAYRDPEPLESSNEE